MAPPSAPQRPSPRQQRTRIAERLQRAGGRLTTAATTRMEEEMEWFRQLSAEDRSWIGLIVESGIQTFLTWYRDPDGSPALATDVFGAAPRALTGVVSLHQTVELVRLTIEVVEASVDDIVGPDDTPGVRDSVTRYARELAFATAEVYARAAEMRGAWDARLEALLVDAVLRAEADETLISRASAVGWRGGGDVAVVLGRAVAERGTAVDDVRRAARGLGLEVLGAVQGDRLVVVVGGLRGEREGHLHAAAACVAEHCGEGPVVVGPAVESLGRAHASARAAVAGLRAAPGWPGAPRPVASEDLLPERALSGDGHARRRLVEEIFDPLVAAGGGLLGTLTAYADHGGSVEGTGRALFIHANTVRYRLRRIADLTGLAPTDPRDLYTLRVALTLGRLARVERT